MGYDEIIVAVRDHNKKVGDMRDGLQELFEQEFLGLMRQLVSVADTISINEDGRRQFDGELAEQLEELLNLYTDLYNCTDRFRSNRDYRSIESMTPRILT